MTKQTTEGSVITSMFNTYNESDLRTYQCVYVIAIEVGGGRNPILFRQQTLKLVQ